MLYAEKGLIARLEPGMWGPPESYEWYMSVPPGIGLTIFCSGVQNLSKDVAMAQDNWTRLVQKLAEERPDCIIVGGLPVAAYGKERHGAAMELLGRVRKMVNVPVISALTATVDSLRALGARRLAVAAPYPPDVDAIVRAVLEDYGFEIASWKGLGLPMLSDINRQEPDVSYKMALQAFEAAPEADAIFISCPAWPVVRNIAKLEAVTKKPVLTATTAQVYVSLKAMRLKTPVEGFGRLLEELPAWDASGL